MTKLNHRKQDDKYFEALKISPDFIGDNPETMEEGTICPEEIIPLSERIIKCVKANILNVRAKEYYPIEDVKNSINNFLKELEESPDFDDEDNAFIDKLSIKYFGEMK